MSGFLELFVPSAASAKTVKFILTVVLVLVSVKIAGDLSVRFGQPSVFGKLLVGLVIGPSFLGWIQPTSLLSEFAEIGVLMLMFIAGLETDVAEFMKTAGGAAVAAVLGVIAPLAAGFGLAMLYGYSWSVSLFVGSILVATSVSISVQTLRELGKLQTREGFTILGAAVIDDILGLIVLSIVLGLELGQGGGTAGILALFVKVFLFFALAVLMGRKIVPSLLKFASKMGVSVPVVTAGIVIALVFAAGAELMGMAGIVGAYLAGLMISMTSFKHEIFEGVEHVGYAFFIPFFFVNIGVIADVRGLTVNMAVFTLLALIMAVATKVIGCGAGALISGLTPRESLRVGVGMIARGEVALIIAGIGLDSGLITRDLFTSMVIVAIATTVVTPPLLRAVITEPEPRNQEPGPLIK